MRTIRASEISSFIYCQRAWWYRLQGMEPDNQAELTAGTELHQRHGRQVLAAGILNGLAWLLVLLGLVLLVFFLVTQFL